MKDISGAVNTQAVPCQAWRVALEASNIARLTIHLTIAVKPCILVKKYENVYVNKIYDGNSHIYKR
jgi:hypothetical protein